MPASAGPADGITAVEAVLWTIAVLAMLPYPLASVARLYYGGTGPEGNVGEPEAAITAERDTGITAGRPAVPDTKLWSDSRKAALARLLAVGDVEPSGRLLLPHQSRGIAVFEGATEVHMTLGAGRLLETSDLTGKGNIVLTAHRDGAFRALKDLGTGDRIALETGAGLRAFEVSELLIVSPTALHVLEPTTTTTLTLITCYPFYFAGSAPDRYVVRAELVQTAARHDNVRAATRRTTTTPEDNRGDRQ